MPQGLRYTPGAPPQSVTCCPPPAMVRCPAFPGLHSGLKLSHKFTLTQEIIIFKRLEAFKSYAEVPSSTRVHRMMMSEKGGKKIRSKFARGVLNATMWALYLLSKMR